jgi:hypothetical protein
MIGKFALLTLPRYKNVCATHSPKTSSRISAGRSHFRNGSNTNRELLWHRSHRDSEASFDEPYCCNYRRLSQLGSDWQKPLAFPALRVDTSSLRDDDPINVRFYRLSDRGFIASVPLAGLLPRTESEERHLMVETVHRHLDRWPSGCCNHNFASEVKSKTSDSKFDRVRRNKRQFLCLATSTSGVKAHESDSRNVRRRHLISPQN